MQCGCFECRAVALGEKVFGAHCAACHGADLKERPNWRSPLPNGCLPAPPHDDSGHTWHHDGQSLFAVIEFVAVKFTAPDIESDMPAHAEIQTADEIPAVLARSSCSDGGSSHRQLRSAPPVRVHKRGHRGGVEPLQFQVASPR